MLTHRRSRRPLSTPKLAVVTGLPCVNAALTSPCSRIGATSAADAPPPIPGLGCNPGDTRWVCMPLGFPYYYRVQGPTFLVEYMNTTGNHSHSVWRDFQNGDFGEDLLRAHYATVPHEGVVLMNRFALR